VESWSQDLSNKICRYMNLNGANTHTLSRKDSYLKDKILRTRLLNGESVFGHIVSSTSRRKRGLTRRSATDSGCYFVDLECSDSQTCGVMPRFSMLSREHTPKSGPGAFPWQVTLYRNGEYHCGATLVHAFWVLTHANCASEPPSAIANFYAHAGGHKQLFSYSAHEQFRRVVAYFTIPQTNVSLGLLSSAFDLNEYVNVVCIPSVTWLPVREKCYFTGRFDGVLNHAVETTLRGVCHYKDDDNYKLCTQQSIASNECLQRWSGALVCPDETNTYYAVGVYHSMAANCGVNPSERTPTLFDALVTQAVRDGIQEIVKTKAAGSGIGPVPSCDGALCPNGKCLMSEKVCDRIPDCGDFSDENPTLCAGLTVPEMCKDVNATHCECRESKLMCANKMCLDRTKFCNKVDDCGDGSDEVEGCDECLGHTKLFEKGKLCDGTIDCQGKFDIGVDEGAAECCSNITLNLNASLGEYPYRCVQGDLDPSLHFQDINLSNECINSRYVCDWNYALGAKAFLPTVENACSNGADEKDCIALWPYDYYANTQPKRDPFGRFVTNQAGHLYFVAFGQKYLYCANNELWTETNRVLFGRAICKHEGYPDLQDVALHDVRKRTFIGEKNGIKLSSSEDLAYRTCKIVFIRCKERGHYYY